MYAKVYVHELYRPWLHTGVVEKNHKQALNTVLFQVDEKEQDNRYFISQKYISENVSIVDFW